MKKKYSRCWLPDKNNKKWILSVKKFKYFKNIYIKYNNFIKKEITFFIDKKIINFTNKIKNASLIFLKKTLLEEEYIIIEKKKKIFIYSKKNTGFLYGLYYLFRLIQTNKIYKIKNIFINEKPSSKIRMINHLDNIDGSIKSGYSGNSIFFLNNKINYDLYRINFYAKLLCSIGINSISINNTNVDFKSTYLITKKWLIQIKELYNIFIKYNIKIFISIRYDSPIILSKLKTFNPLNNDVILWWKKKINEIYKYMPLFGGFIINTNLKSKGPLYYNINHARGSKLISKPLKKFNGILFWKCFLTNINHSWKNKKIDKTCITFNYFKKLDKYFPKNVVLQIKNGPIGFQVREPVSPLIGSMKYTSQIIELQINQEYTGQQIDLCWLPMQWKYILNFDTYLYGHNSTIKKIISGKINNMKYFGATVISNIGNNWNWTKNILSQSNLFSYGKILWNNNINLNNILKEWIKLSIKNNKKVIKNIRKILINSWKTYEKYTNPLGLSLMVDPVDNYTPNIDGYEYNNYGIYHYADRKKIGYNRTSFGSKFTNQYSNYNKNKFNNIKRCPESLLLFFHRLSYKFILKKYNKTIIQYIYDIHFEGVKNVFLWINLWNKLKKLIPIYIFSNVKKNLIKQYFHSKEWKDKINSYFFRKSGIDDKLKRNIYKT